MRELAGGAAGTNFAGRDAGAAGPDESDRSDPDHSAAGGSLIAAVCSGSGARGLRPSWRVRRRDGVCMAKRGRRREVRPSPTWSSEACLSGANSGRGRGDNTPRLGGAARLGRAAILVRVGGKFPRKLSLASLTSSRSQSLRAFSAQGSACSSAINALHSLGDYVRFRIVPLTRTGSGDGYSIECMIINHLDEYLHRSQHRSATPCALSRLGSIQLSPCASSPL